MYEAHVLGWVADDYFARSLTAILVEGEEGYPLTQAPFTTSTDEEQIAGFSSRGFASFSLDSLTQVNRLQTQCVKSGTEQSVTWQKY